jgi:hypothetical protein
MNNNFQGVNMLNQNPNNYLQGQSQKMSQLQYIKNNNINIINNSVLKVPEQVPINSTNTSNSNISTMKSTYESDINNVSSSLKKKIKLDGELQIPLMKAKSLKQNVQNYNEMGNEELVENSYLLAKDQGGCRYLQKKIEEEHDFSNIYLFPKVLLSLNKLCDNLSELINDSFGNYLIQKMLEHLDERNLLNFLVNV